MILVLGKSALSVPDTRFSRVSGSTLVITNKRSIRHGSKLVSLVINRRYFMPRNLIFGHSVHSIRFWLRVNRLNKSITKNILYFIWHPSFGHGSSYCTSCKSEDLFNPSTTGANIGGTPPSGFSQTLPPGNSMPSIKVKPGIGSISQTPTSPDNKLGMKLNAV